MDADQRMSYREEDEIRRDLERVSDAEADAYMAELGLDFSRGRRHASISGITDGPDPDSIDRACEDYVAGRIDVDELEQRIEARLRELDS